MAAETKIGAPMSRGHLKLFRYLDLADAGEQGDWTVGEVLRGHVYQQIARESEEALYDGVFRADVAAAARGGQRDLERNQYGWFGFDAFQHLAAAGAVTTHLGLVGTASCTFNLPYNLARQLQTLDHLTGGRVGWNAVTSFQGEKAFGLKELPPQEERYARAAEFLEIVHGLWASWQPGSVDLDADPRKISNADLVQPIAFHGKYFDVEGPSTMPRTPQGWPVQFQAGASGSAKEFAARFAEVIYTASPHIDHARRAYAEMKSLVAAAGRNPDHTLITPGYHPFVAPTRAEAQERFEARYDAVDLQAGLREIEERFGGIDMSALDLDQPVPEAFLPDTSKLRGRQSRPGLYIEMARQPGVTLRRLIQLVGGEDGHYTSFGSYDDIADELALWLRSRAADGFVIGLRGGGAKWAEFNAEVIPRLQSKGIFRRKYEGVTLRENLGLPTPAGALRR
jgi:N-acetyl-S-(2-succino)cysteine monooxygenase